MPESITTTDPAPSSLLVRPALGFTRIVSAVGLMADELEVPQGDEPGVATVRSDLLVAVDQAKVSIGGLADRIAQAGVNGTPVRPVPERKPVEPARPADPPKQPDPPPASPPSDRFTTCACNEVMGGPDGLEAAHHEWLVTVEDRGFAGAVELVMYLVDDYACAATPGQLRWLDFEDFVSVHNWRDPVGMTQLASTLRHYIQADHKLFRLQHPEAAL